MTTLHTLKGFYTSLFKPKQGRLNDAMIGRCFGIYLNAKSEGSGCDSQKGRAKRVSYKQRDIKSFKIQSVAKAELKDW